MAKIYGLVILLCGALAVCAMPERSMVVSSTDMPNNEMTKEANVSETHLSPKIYQMDIVSNVSNRYAKTVVTSRVNNPASSAKEVVFTVILPENAFISEFVMEIGGKSYKAHVKPKEEAKQEYLEAKNRGQSAAHVEVSARDSNRFTVSVNVESEGKAAFFLTYEELLQRQNDQYELVVNIHPGQLVKELTVKVNIEESRPLRFVRTPPLRSGNEISKNDSKKQPKVQVGITNSSGVVTFHPSVEDQEAYGDILGTKEGKGLNGQFVVQYDVQQDPQGGEVLIRDGYFVHFFSPSDLKPLPKHVVFILDTSGSMGGLKIDQLRNAMESILSDIKGDNILSLVDFDTNARVWDINNENYTTIYSTDDFEQLKELNLPESVVTNDGMIEKAKRIVKNLKAGSMTNMKDGLNAGLYLVKEASDKHKSKYQPLIIFLTDGLPSFQSSGHITERVTKFNANHNKVPIFTLSFGEGADKKFLRELSSKNSGFSRHIYEAADAAVQLQRFFQQISSPLLSDVSFKYEAEVEDTTKTIFPIYFKGSEMVVSGRIDPHESSKFVSKIESKSVDGHIILQPTVKKSASSLERLWAYITVKQALQEREYAHNKEELTKKALDIALKYSFVTEVTSLVVVKPNETTAVQTENAALPNVQDRSFAAFYGPRPGAASTFARGFSNTYQARSGPSIYPQAFYVPGFQQPKFKMQMTTEVPFSSSGRSLHWLNSVINQNGTITLPQGTFKLRHHAFFGVYQRVPCSKNAVNGGPGICVYFQDCPKAYPVLTDFDTYKQYFCQVENTDYAGVCCSTPVTQDP